MLLTYAISVGGYSAEPLYSMVVGVCSGDIIDAVVPFQFSVEHRFDRLRVWDPFQHAKALVDRSHLERLDVYTFFGACYILAEDFVHQAKQLLYTLVQA